MWIAIPFVKGQRIGGVGRSVINRLPPDIRLMPSFATEHQIHVTGAFKLLKNDIIHAAAGVDQNSGDNGQGTAIFDLAGGAEYPPRHRKGIRSQSAG